MKPVRCKKLDHVGIFVSDLEKSIGFYRDVLGMELAERDEDEFALMATLRAGKREIHLFEPKEGGTRPHINHLAYRVKPAKFEAAMEGLRELDIPFSGPHPYKDTLFIKFKDPSGLTWEYICQAQETRHET